MIVVSHPTVTVESSIITIAHITSSNTYYAVCLNATTPGRMLIAMLLALAVENCIDRKYSEVQRGKIMCFTGSYVLFSSHRDQNYSYRMLLFSID